jgi:Na+-transporting methylmalonyl-CoA/oxaloacetate decarboxylase gamma subunit
MLSPAWFGVFVTTFGLAIVFLVLAIYVYFRRRMGTIIEDASSLVDLTAKKQGLEAEIEQCMKSLDENREELRKLDAERKQQESLRQELASLSNQVAEEKQKRDQYRTEVRDVQNVVFAFMQDRDWLESRKAYQEIKSDVAEEELRNAEEVKPLVKLRVVRKHKLGSYLRQMFKSKHLSRADG